MYNQQLATCCLLHGKQLALPLWLATDASWWPAPEVARAHFVGDRKHRVLPGCQHCLPLLQLQLCQLLWHSWQVLSRSLAGVQAPQQQRAPPASQHLQPPATKEAVRGGPCQHHRLALDASRCLVPFTSGWLCINQHSILRGAANTPLVQMSSVNAKRPTSDPLVASDTQP